MMNSRVTAPLSCLLFLGLAACSKAPEPAAAGSVTPEAQTVFADVVIRDTTVYTLNAAQPWAQAVAIRDGSIVMVGNNAEAAPLIGPETRVFSQPGGLVLPGFQDAHIHPVSAGLERFVCNLDITPPEVQTYLDKAAECAASLAEGEWLYAAGWWHTVFPPDGIPNKAVLDAVIPDRPAFLLSYDGHSAWANSKAMELAGITAETPDPPLGHIDRDPTSGEPVGSFQEAATKLIESYVPPPPQSQIEEGLLGTIDYLHSLGITAIQEANTPVDPQDREYALPTYRHLADQGKLQLHTVVSLRWNPSQGVEQIPDLVRVRDQFNGGLLNTNTVKIYLDGVIETSTAAMLDDYSDRPGYKGELQIPPGLMNEAVAQLDAEGFQVHVHTIGDAAVREALDAAQFALERNGPGNGRHHLAHVEFVDPADIPRFAELNVNANFSPLWTFPDETVDTLILSRVGPERIRWSYPINSILQDGGRIVFGSDWNVTSPDPLLAIETAVTHIEPLAGQPPPLLPQERITLEQAIAAATINAAYVNHLDDVAGSIEVGKLGDLVILDTNLFEVEPSAISDARVVATLFGGEVVYQRPD